MPLPSRKALLQIVALLLCAYAAIAYLLLPQYWKHYVHKHPSLEDIPGITHTKTGIPGDPLNVALIGAKADLLRIMAAAKWYEAKPLGVRSDLKIATDTVLKRPDDEAPVSNLYLFDRKEDLAFEQPVDNNPRQRHHVRFWKTEKIDSDGRPVWVGSAIYDEHVGLSRTTGQITHVTAPDIDTERDKLFHDLQATGELTEQYTIPDFHKVHTGKNGGGDPWHTDGALWVGVIEAAGAAPPSPPAPLPPGERGEERSPSTTVP